ncbi:MAG: hypothetical protein IPJ04_18455 [Candidatus Eisenbacteria bacterium]|nr:hypothetical protein [Candidatus Eisenbacteria bacterium]
MSFDRRGALRAARGLRPHGQRAAVGGELVRLHERARAAERQRGHERAVLPARHRAGQFLHAAVRVERVLQRERERGPLVLGDLDVLGQHEDHELGARVHDPAHRVLAALAAGALAVLALFARAVTVGRAAHAAGTAATGTAAHRRAAHAAARAASARTATSAGTAAGAAARAAARHRLGRVVGVLRVEPPDPLERAVRRGEVRGTREQRARRLRRGERERGECEQGESSGDAMHGGTSSGDRSAEWTNETGVRSRSRRRRRD